ncbi:hepatitis A virus cellular receptor 1 homolog [Phodopus roborovskii]|uniref:hepatitis A virus cellular receptor 1 homolog n=1 Tax=Phodopus roborovskii TaxID=109678 RepID=UPI0021E35E96|nr:hepatitis A virus cellular receptor 1 homolog [Phodopus roborovskii]
MMHLQVFISGLILLLPDAIESFAEVHGVVGRPVTLPCTYPVSHGISPTCWGQGACFFGKCKDVVILTNGYYVYYKRNNRYHLPGKILQGNVSLTIQKVRESDSGLYCCRVEMKGWEGVHRLTISLKVQPGSDPTPNPPKIMIKGIYIGFSVVLLLLLVVSIMTITKCILTKKKPGSLSLVAATFCGCDACTALKSSYECVTDVCSQEHGTTVFCETKCNGKQSICMNKTTLGSDPNTE